MKTCSFFIETMIGGSNHAVCLMISRDTSCLFVVMKLKKVLWISETVARDVLGYWSSASLNNMVVALQHNLIDNIQYHTSLRSIIYFIMFNSLFNVHSMENVWIGVYTEQLMIKLVSFPRCSLTIIILGPFWCFCYTSITIQFIAYWSVLTVGCLSDMLWNKVNAWYESSDDLILWLVFLRYSLTRKILCSDDSYLSFTFVFHLSLVLTLILSLWNNSHSTSIWVPVISYDVVSLLFVYRSLLFVWFFAAVSFYIHEEGWKLRRNLSM